MALFSRSRVGTVCCGPKTSTKHLVNDSGFEPFEVSVSEVEAVSSEDAAVVVVYLLDDPHLQVLRQERVCLPSLDEPNDTILYLR